MVAGIRISSKVVEDPHDHLVLGAVAAIKDAKFLLKHLQQFLDISMLLPQDLDNVRHRRLPRTTLRAYGTVDMSVTDAHCAKSKRASIRGDTGLSTKTLLCAPKFALNQNGARFTS